MSKLFSLCVAGTIAAGDLLQKTADTNSVMNGLTAAKNEFMTVFKFAINWIVIPIICAVILGFLIFFIAGCVRRHQGQQSYSDKLIGVAICLVALTIVASFPAWGWQMIGESSPKSQSQTQSQTVTPT